MVFDGVFNDLSVDQSVALLSCFVHKETTSKTNKKQASQGSVLLCSNNELFVF